MLIIKLCDIWTLFDVSLSERSTIRDVMTDREGRVTLLGYICLAVFINSYITGSNATLCTDKTDSHGFTNVLAMCKEGTLAANRVVVDTYDTGVLDQDRCQCTVRLTGGGPVLLDYKAYPGTVPASDCGGILRFTTHLTNTYTEYECEQITGDLVRNFANNDLLNITLSRVSADVQWKSGYCILIESAVTLAVLCDSPGTFLGTSTTGSSLTTTTLPTMTTASIPTMTSSTMTSTTLTDARSSCRKCEPSTVPIIAVVVPVVVTLLVVVVGTVTNVILYRRRLTLMNELRTNSHGMYSVDSVHYDSLDRSRVEPPNAYEEFHRGQTYVNTAMGS